MMSENDATFKKSLEDFTAYAQTENYRRDERNYKEQLIRTLGAALTDEALAAADFLERLRDAARQCSGGIANLTHFTTYDDFKNYLGVVSDERMKNLLRALFDERRNLAERFDSFQLEVDADYKKLLERSRPMRWLVSILLAARAPQSYTFYRPSLIENARERWGLAPTPVANDSNGEKYVAYLDFLKPIQERLSIVLERPADLIDVHSFLWRAYSQRPRDAAPTWREKLAEWLRTNPKTIPEEFRRLREEFLRRFPKSSLSGLTLEQYALGHEGYRDSFSYWLEFGTKKLGHIAGTAAKFGVWHGKEGWRWNRFYLSAEDALARIKSGLIALVAATEQGRFGELDEIGSGFGNGLRSKPLSLYFPELLLPVWQPEHIAYFLSLFAAEAEGGVLARNRELLRVMREQPEFAGFDTMQMMLFLYQNFPPPGLTVQGEAGVTSPIPQPQPTRAEVPDKLKPLFDITARTRNILLYGPPGTGKTWLVNHFTNYFLLHHNVSPEAAGDYWRVKGTNEGRQLSARVRAETGARTGRVPAFWWITANEKEWSWETLFAEGEWCFKKRRPARNFVAAKPGDFIFGYLASPHKHLVALARVEAGLETRVFKGEERECLLIKPVGEMFTHPLAWHKLLDNAVLKESEPVRHNAQGTLFRLTTEEAQELTRMLNNEGNDFTLPTEARGDFTEFVTFHQSFAYEEFVEGLKPVLEKEEADEAGDESENTAHGGAARGLGYKIQRGVFREICERARRAWQARPNDPPKYLLVIDEINRANIAKVLGELITLIEDDKRLGEENEVTARLPYSGERFGVPPNLYILGTMNTADRSIALLDLALRRRFTFVEMMPDVSAIEPAMVAGVDLQALLRRINARVAALLDRDHQIGHSYFLGLGDADDLRFAWYHRIVPLLGEYFYNDGARLREILGSRFVVPPGGDAATRDEFTHESERTRYEIRELEGDAFLDALNALARATPEGMTGGGADSVEQEE